MYFAACAKEVSFRAPRSPEVPGNTVLRSIPIASILSNNFASTQSFCFSCSRRACWDDSRSVSALNKGRSKWFVDAVCGSFDRYNLHFRGSNGAGRLVDRLSSNESALDPPVSAILLSGLPWRASSIFCSRTLYCSASSLGSIVVSSSSALLSTCR